VQIHKKVGTKNRKNEVVKGDNNPMFDKHQFQETRRKLSEANNGENHPMFGKHLP
jgi:hypothetical protein